VESWVEPLAQRAAVSPAKPISFSALQLTGYPRLPQGTRGNGTQHGSRS